MMVMRTRRNKLQDTGREGRKEEETELSGTKN